MTFALVPHRSTPFPWVKTFTAALSLDGSDIIRLECELRGPHIDRIKTAELDGEHPRRVDGLWRTTCFEAFIGIPEGHYVEFNFAPDGNWAAYCFTGRRKGMHQIEVTPPQQFFQSNCDGTFAEFHVGIDRRAVPPGNVRIGICAVLEDDEGRLSCWALAHPEGPPDFHHPDCFALDLGQALAA